MRTAWLLALGVGLMAACGSAAPAPTGAARVVAAPPAVVPSPVAGEDPSGAVPAHTAPTDAAPPAAAPPDAGPPAAPSDLEEVADAAPYVYRRTSFGLAVFSDRKTSVLRRAGDKASLRVITEEDAVTPRVPRGQPDAWQITSTETFVGTVRRDGKRLRLDLASATGQQLKLSCRAHRMAVHREGAEIIPTPRVPGKRFLECGNGGVWRPPATQRIDVLACSEMEDYLDDVVDRGDSASGLVLTLAPLPGIELVSINNDCALQESGHRRISPHD